MKIQKKAEYPPEIGTIIEDYNGGVDRKDISDVDVAVTSLVTNALAPNPEFRKAAVDALIQIANVQPGFLKNAVRILTSKYKQGGERAEWASLALYKIFIPTKAAPLFTEQDIVQKITEEENVRTAAQRAETQLQTQFLQKVKSVGVDLAGLTGSVYSAGNYYNKCLVDDDFQAALTAVNKLIDDAIATYPDNFIQACLLLGRIGSEANRKEFFKKSLNYLLEKTRGKKNERAPAEEMLESIIVDVVDLLPADMAGKIQAEAAKKGEQRKKEAAEKALRDKKIAKGTVEIDYKWDPAIRDLANQYNAALVAEKEKDKEKEVNAAINTLDKFLLDKVEKIRLDAARFLRQLLMKNKDIVQKTVDRLMKTCRKPESSEICGEMLDVLKQMNVYSADTIAQLDEDKRIRDAAREKQRAEDQKKYEEIEKVSIKFDSNWEEKIVKICENFNQFMLSKKEKDAQKLVTDLDKYVYAEDKEIRKQAASAMQNIADKYPEFLAEPLKKLVMLFESQHERREIASEALAIINQSDKRDQIFKDVNKETLDKINTENEERMKKADDQALQDKWQSIRMDVVPVSIKDTWPKNVQDLMRRYNEGIKTQNKEKVQTEIKTVVEGVMTEKKEEKLQVWIEVLGGIAEKNIELIAPTINLLLEWVSEKSEDKKFRAIQGLGEVAVARPGWAYQAIEKLFNTIKSDDNQKARIKSFIEIRRIAKKEATMLIEYVENFTATLKDNNKDIRLQCAMTLDAMADIIASELTDLIEPLTEALHDEYPLVRTFADKALNKIRMAMRK